jgi:lipopolysaccharide export LptBFGC system permease protein LptF
MKRRIIKKLIKMLLSLAFVFAMIVCFIRFVGAEDVYDKVEYGIWSVILLIFTLKE